MKMLVMVGLGHLGRHRVKLARQCDGLGATPPLSLDEKQACPRREPPTQTLSGWQLCLDWEIQPTNQHIGGREGRWQHLKLQLKYETKAAELENPPKMWARIIIGCFTQAQNCVWKVRFCLCLSREILTKMGLVVPLWWLSMNSPTCRVSPLVSTPPPHWNRPFIALISSYKDDFTNKFADKQNCEQKYLG